MAKAQTARKQNHLGPGPELADRMMRYGRHPSCPECQGDVACLITRPGYALYRCIDCGHRFENQAEGSHG